MAKNNENNISIESLGATDIELVRNPFIATYLNEVQNEGKKDVSNFEFFFNPEELIPINQDLLYNDKVSYCNIAYRYSDKVREATNIRYIRSNSDIISSRYRDNLIEFGADNDDAFLIPFDYILVTRADGSQFLIAEDFSNTKNISEFHKYTIIRYAGKTCPFKTNTIYSNGIDLARLLSGDVAYIDTFANHFLSEQRLEESLLSAYSALDAQRSDETNHGGGYVGYIDSKTLDILGTLERNELLLFEKTIGEGRV